MGTDTRAVYFRYEDYASFWRRLAVDLIDVTIVLAVCAVAALMILFIAPTSSSLNLVLAVSLLIFFLYFVLLKRSRFRTVGYRVGGVRIVGMDGSLPSIFALTLRCMFATLGPLNWFLDIGFLSGDPHRQSLRDKFALTYVVKLAAEPVGTAKLVHQHIEICGYNFLFREVRPDPDQASPAPKDTNQSVTDEH